MRKSRQRRRSTRCLSRQQRYLHRYLMSFLQQRATDFRDIKARILKILLGIEDYDISAAPAGTVLVAHDLTPSMTAGIVAENIAGILTEVGGRTSHSAILARAMEIPAVLSIDGICTAVKNGDRVVLNGTSGEAIVNP